MYLTSVFSNSASGGPRCKPQRPAIATAKAADVEERALTQNNIPLFEKAAQHYLANVELLHDGSFGVWMLHALAAMLAEAHDNVSNRSLKSFKQILK